MPLQGFLAHSFKLKKDYPVRKYGLVFLKTQLQIIYKLCPVLYLTPKSVGNAEIMITFRGIDKSKINGEIARTLEYYTRVKY